MKTFNLLYMMTSRRNPWTAALLMIIIKALSSLSLTCHPAEYQIGKECCPLCSAGTRVKIDCTEDRSTSCLPCIKGTYMDNPTGRKECFSCTNCDAGSGLKVKRSCTVTSDAVCEPMEGFYCIDYKGDKCEAAQRHTSCKPGQYIQVNGTAYRDTECSDCSDGTFSNGTLTSCQPHRQCEAEKLQLIKAGTPSDDAQCGETTTNVGVTVGVIITVLVLCAGLFVAFIFYKRQKPYHPAANGDNPIERNHRVSAAEQIHILQPAE
ncbi:tumor necrosis factor receptor superfamily member 14-like isoform X2 [Parambassis ranga]|uniref:Tumor necrosis factor receptor superfamily member 14-like isoform X2 n=1 Tax=Parambassis ranga TaxID=210632 RepID=A0A6P7IUB8_9TELE|nr:tumor necrosis factor receptor superfamily member 14-like isoform X2 [Parambassis ranga]